MLKLLAFIAGTVIGSLLSIDFVVGRELEKAAIFLPVVLALTATLYYELVEPTQSTDTDVD